MSARLRDLIREKVANRQKMLSVFVTAGFPQKKDTAEIILALDAAGVDFIELGVPFSDPIADGPVIQAASDRALANGISLAKVFRMVEMTRRHSQIPIILMGYLNPFLRMGLEKAAELSRKSGVDGWIIPDWPLEESRKFIPLVEKNGIDLIHLVAPNTPQERIGEIAALSKAFVYCTAYTGVTGSEEQCHSGTLQFFKTLRNRVTQPLMIGFGIKTPADFRFYASLADGVIVGSAFIRFLNGNSHHLLKPEVIRFVNRLRGR